MTSALDIWHTSFILTTSTSRSEVKLHSHRMKNVPF